MSFISIAVDNIDRHAETGKFIFYLPTPEYEIVSLIAHRYLELDPRRGANAADRLCERPDSLKDFCRHANQWRMYAGEWCGNPNQLPPDENTPEWLTASFYGALSLTPSTGDLQTENYAGFPVLADICQYIQYQTAMQLRTGKRRVSFPLFLFGTALRIPSCMEPYTEVIEIPNLEADDVEELVWQIDRKEMPREAAAFYAEQFSTCTLPEARTILQDAHDAYGTLYKLDKKVMNRGSETLRDYVQNRVSEMLNRKIRLHNMLSVEVLEPGLPDPVGMDNVIRWYERHREALKSGSEYAPKGLLLTGVSGCGKTYFAKWMAQKMYGRMVKLDMSAVLGSFVGQSEVNIAGITNDLEQCGSFVLLVDEGEKKLAGSKGDAGDGGVMRRVAGKLMEWLQDRRNMKVFVVFTSNDMSTLPSELYRSGRLDARFIVLCPRYEELIRLLEAKLGDKLRHYSRACIQRLWEKQHAFMTGADIDSLAREIKLAVQRGEAMDEVINDLACSFRPQQPSMDRPEIIRCYQSYFEDSYISANRAFSFDPTIYHREQPLLFLTQSSEDNPLPIKADDLTEELKRMEEKLRITYHDYDRKLLDAVNMAMGRQIIRNINGIELEYLSKIYRKA